MISHRTLPGALIETVRERIINGELAAGSRIDQDALAAEFGVSRMPVREALRQLDAEGFVTLVPHRGAVVSQLGSAEVEEIYEMRAVLEGLACRLALPNMSEADLDAVNTALEAMSKTTDIREWTTLNAQFHAGLFTPCHREHLLKVIERLRRQSEPYVRMYVHLLRGEIQADREHHAIYDAVVAKDGEEVERLVRAHLVGTGQGVARYLNAEAPTHEEEDSK
jgi:DNA-binding GntR family transcriptional regulator